MKKQLFITVVFNIVIAPLNFSKGSPIVDKKCPLNGRVLAN